MTASFTLTAAHHNGHPARVTFRAEFPTVELARAYAAQFPKAVRARTSTLFSLNAAVRGLVLVDINLVANRATGQHNETGIRRYHSTRRHLARLGATVQWHAPYRNSYPTEAAFVQALTPAGDCHG